jgi:hypothetical protein
VAYLEDAANLAVGQPKGAENLAVALGGSKLQLLSFHNGLLSVFIIIILSYLAGKIK